MAKDYTKIKLCDYQPYKFDRTPRVSDKDMEEYDRLIYNDLPIVPKYYEECPELDTSWLKNISKEGEEWKEIDTPSKLYVVSSMGRVINTLTMKQLKVTKMGRKVYLYLEDQKVDFSEIFPQYDWVYSPSVILSDYARYGWRIKIFNRK